jgi:Agrobacterium VirD5 protein
MNFGLALASLPLLPAAPAFAVSASASAAATTGAAASAKPSKGKKRKRDLENPYTTVNPIVVPARNSYGQGMHGAKTAEQKRLTANHMQAVSGDTHESEHPIGFEPINQTNPEKRGTKGRTKQLENMAPAYQEVHRLHRDHIGTGVHGEADASGMNSEQYRASQRRLLEAGDPNAAIQLNQLAYAFDPRFNHGDAAHPANLDIDRVDLQQANDSYSSMVTHVKGFAYANDQIDEVAHTHTPHNQQVQFGPGDKVEMLAARLAAQLGRWPNATELIYLEKVASGKIAFHEFMSACAKKDLTVYLMQDGNSNAEAIEINQMAYTAKPPTNNVAKAAQASAAKSLFQSNLAKASASHASSSSSSSSSSPSTATAAAGTAPTVAATPVVAMLPPPAFAGLNASATSPSPATPADHAAAAALAASQPPPTQGPLVPPKK